MKNIFRPPWPTSKNGDLDSKTKSAFADGISREISIQALMDIINRLFRIQKTIEHHGDSDQKEASLILRNVHSALDTFCSMGFKIQDHTGEVVPEGGSMSWKVISYQEEKATDNETVIETLKPTIYFKDVPVQRGEVVIACPENRISDGDAQKQLGEDEE